MKTSLMRVSVSELCERQEMSHTLVVELVELEIASPIEGDSVENWVFDATGAMWMQKALRLHRDLQLEWEAIGALVGLIRERDHLQKENALLRRKLERFLAD